MAIDETLTARLRDALGGVEGVEEKKMMGGVCFMVGGHMLGGAHVEKTGRRRFMFRIGKDNMAEALSDPTAHEVTMGARKLGGFIHVEDDDCPDAALRKWVALALSFLATLPPRP